MNSANPFCHVLDYVDDLNDQSVKTHLCLNESGSCAVFYIIQWYLWSCMFHYWYNWFLIYWHWNVICKDQILKGLFLLLHQCAWCLNYNTFQLCYMTYETFVFAFHEDWWIFHATPLLCNKDVLHHHSVRMSFKFTADAQKQLPSNPTHPAEHLWKKCIFLSEFSSHAII